MACRRLVLSSCLRRYNWSPRIVSSTSFSLDSFKRKERTAAQFPPTHQQHQLICIRSFSVVEGGSDEEKERSYRDRARDGAQKARQHYRTSKKKGAKAAAKGAKTAGEMLQQYGPVFVGTYMSVYFISWGLLFVGMDSGLLDPVQIMGYIGGGAEEGKSTVHLVVEYMEKYAWTKPYAATVEENPHFASLAVAWVTNKFTEPARLVFTMAIVPKLARHFGFVKVDDDEHDDDMDANVEHAEHTETTLDGEHVNKKEEKETATNEKSAK